MIYFDNAASARPLNCAVDALNKVLGDSFSNPSALHKGGIEAEMIVKSARDVILPALSHLRLHPSNPLHRSKVGDRLIFTSGATESNNAAILSSIKPRGRKKIVTTKIEHPSVSETVKALGENGYEIVYVNPSPRIADDIISEVDSDTALVTMTAVCSETGFFTNPSLVYGEIKRAFPDCIVHTDFSQGFLKDPVCVPCGDLISVSAHKIGGVVGVGGLVVRSSVRIKPINLGGGQQGGFRSGTVPVALIAAFGATVEEGVKLPFDFSPLKKRLVCGIDTLGLRGNGFDGFSDKDMLSHIVSFPTGVKSEVMLHFLAQNKIYASNGSACSRGQKSRILPAYKIPDRDIDTTIRISFSRLNTINEIDEFLNVLEKGIKSLRR